MSLDVVRNLMAKYTVIFGLWIYLTLIIGAIAFIIVEYIDKNIEEY